MLTLIPAAKVLGGGGGGAGTAPALVAVALLPRLRKR